jgi:hypothetical protein
MKKLVLLVALLMLAVPASASAKTYLGGCSPNAHAKYKPKRILFSCGSGGIRIKGAKWSSWRARRARGRGRARVNDCNPNCAQGTIRTYRVRLRLSKAVTCQIGPRRQFTLVTLIFRNRRPSGFPKSLRGPRVCSRR